MQTTITIFQYAAAASANVSPDSGLYWERSLPGSELLRLIRGEERVCVTPLRRNYLGAMVHNTARHWEAWNTRWGVLWPREASAGEHAPLWMLPNKSARNEAAAESKSQ